ncbi:MAG: hypothetical protein UU62_C0037G0009 [Candidatus Uhrbacteria bacterium GW2011_GWF2_41_40]|nr:MAG: hypothetical protein UU62_C0037G0009 [Candidatus Uhrbacteria bacterium GW2011_GWF2_41_40]
MAAIVSFGYYEFAVPYKFDLNQLHHFQPVKKSGKDFIPAETHEISVVFSKKVIDEPEEIEEHILEETKEKAERYERLFRTQHEETEKTKKELNCLKQQLQELTKEKEPNNANESI